MTTIHSFAEWVQVIGGVLASAGILLGIMYWAAKPVLQRWITEETQKQLDSAMNPVRLELRTMVGELGRVRVIEQKLENGMTERLGRVETDLAAIRSHLMGGRWDGTDRRR